MILGACMEAVSNHHVVVLGPLVESQGCHEALAPAAFNQAPSRGFRPPPCGIGRASLAVALNDEEMSNDRLLSDRGRRSVSSELD